MALEGNFSTEVKDLVTDIVSGGKARFSEAVYKSVYQNSDITSEHTVVPGVRNGTVLPILDASPSYDKFPFQDRDCGDEECATDDNYSAYKWDTAKIGCKVPICMESFDDNFLQFWNRCPENTSLDGALVDYLLSKYQRDFNAALWRSTYFGDTDSNSDLLNGFDGFFAQAEAAGSEQRVIISENSEATKAEQQLDGEAVYNYLKQMYNQAAQQGWFDPDNLEFRITKRMATALVSYLNDNNDKSLGCDCIDPTSSVSRRVFMLEGLHYFGIPVLVESAWDGVIHNLSDFTVDDAFVNPNRAILTYRSNLLIGTCDVNTLENFNIWYSQDQDKIYMRGKSILGAGIPNPDELIIAY